MVTDQGTLATNVGDIAMNQRRRAVRLVARQDDANSGNYTDVNTGTAASISSQNDGILTYQINQMMPTTSTGAPNYIPYNSGVQFTAMAYSQTGTMLRTVRGRPDSARRLLRRRHRRPDDQLDLSAGPQHGRRPEQSGQPALPTNATTVGLLPGVNLVMPVATGPVGVPEVNAGETVTIPAARRR